MNLLISRTVYPPDWVEPRENVKSSVNRIERNDLAKKMTLRTVLPPSISDNFNDFNVGVLNQIRRAKS